MTRTYLALLVSLSIIFNAISLTFSCDSIGSLVCNGQTFATFTCSPPLTSPTGARLTLNDFSEGGEGGDRSECDDQYHDNNELIAALSTWWYDSGSRCGSMITISASNGRSVTAKVVDECDSPAGCDDEHGGQPPCDNNVVDGSAAVWNALGLDQAVGIVDETWSMA